MALLTAQQLLVGGYLEENLAAADVELDDDGDLARIDADIRRSHRRPVTDLGSVGR